MISIRLRNRVEGDQHRVQLWAHDANGEVTHAEVNTDDHGTAIAAARVFGLIATGHPEEEAEPHVCPPAPTPGQHGQELAALRAVRDAAEAVEAVWSDVDGVPTDQLAAALRSGMAKLSTALRPFREGG